MDYLLSIAHQVIPPEHAPIKEGSLLEDAPHKVMEGAPGFIIGKDPDTIRTSRRAALVPPFEAFLRMDRPFEHTRIC